MRGSGKTTVSKILSQKLGIKVVDTDSLIEAQEKMPIKNIVNKNGWEYFRNLETKLLKNLDLNNDFILSTGGGIILKEENRKLLKKLGIIFYLLTFPETSYNRTGNDKNRPMLTQADKMLDDLKNLFEERREIYESAADFTINTEILDANEVSNNILRIFNS